MYYPGRKKVVIEVVDSIEYFDYGFVFRPYAIIDTELCYRPFDSNYIRLPILINKCKGASDYETILKNEKFK